MAEGHVPFPLPRDIEQRTEEALQSLGPQEVLIRIYRPTLTSRYHLRVDDPDDNGETILEGFTAASEVKAGFTVPGPIELSRQLREKWTLISVNGVQLSSLPFSDRLEVLKGASGLVFMVFHATNARVDQEVAPSRLRRPGGNQGQEEVGVFKVGDEVEVADPENNQWERAMVKSVKDGGGSYDVVVGLNRGPFPIIHLDPTTPSASPSPPEQAASTILSPANATSTAAYAMPTTVVDPTTGSSIGTTVPAVTPSQLQPPVATPLTSSSSSSLPPTTIVTTVPATTAVPSGMTTTPLSKTPTTTPSISIRSPPQISTSSILSYTPSSIVMAPVQLRCWDTTTTTPWPARILHATELQAHKQRLGDPPNRSAVRVVYLGLGGHHRLSTRWIHREYLTIVTIKELRDLLTDHSSLSQTNGEASPTTIVNGDLDYKVGLAWAIRLAEIEATAVLKRTLGSNATTSRSLKYEEIDFKYEEIDLRCPWRCRTCMVQNGGDDCDCKSGLSAFIKKSVNVEANRRCCGPRYEHCPAENECGKALLVYLWAKECRGDPHSRLPSVHNERELPTSPMDKGTGVGKRRAEEVVPGGPDAKRICEVAREGIDNTSKPMDLCPQNGKSSLSPGAFLQQQQLGAATLPPHPPSSTTGAGLPLPISSRTTPDQGTVCKPVPLDHTPSPAPGLIPSSTASFPTTLASSGNGSQAFTSPGSTAGPPATINNPSLATVACPTNDTSAAVKAALPNPELLVSEEEIKSLKYQQAYDPFRDAVKKLQPNGNFFRNMIATQLKEGLTNLLKSVPPVAEALTYIQCFGMVVDAAVIIHQLEVDKARQAQSSTTGGEGGAPSTESLEAMARDVQICWRNFQFWTKVKYPEIYYKKWNKSQQEGTSEVMKKEDGSGMPSRHNRSTIR